jgi:magnesium-transporting ATPase (P-type)
VHSREIAAGQRVQVRAGEIVPVDAKVLAGAALVDESAISASPAPVRRVMGQQVLAGSRLLAGALDLDVMRSGDETRAARITQTLVATTVPAPRTCALEPGAKDPRHRWRSAQYPSCGRGCRSSSSRRRATSHSRAREWHARRSYGDLPALARAAR